MFNMWEAKLGDELANAYGLRVRMEGVNPYSLLFSVGMGYGDKYDSYEVDQDGVAICREPGCSIVGLADGSKETPTNTSRHRAILDQLAETYAKKNADYGDSFSKSIDRRGYVAALTRMDDKMERLDQLLINGHAANYESALDSALDLANYAIMLAMYLEAHK